MVLAGQDSPERPDGLRAAYLGGGHGFTPAVVAAVHPEAEVWHWDPDVRAVEHARRVRDAADLENLAVHEYPAVPDRIGNGHLDLIVVDGVLDTVDDDLRARVVDAVAASLRPGGLLCVSYRTVVGWGEVAPVHHLVRELAGRDPRTFAASVSGAVATVHRLRAGGAAYFAKRPVVDAWWQELRALPNAVLVERLFAQALRPISHAQVVEAFTPGGCTYVGPARAADLVEPDLEATLAEVLGSLDPPLVREALGDLVVRRTHRTDLFRLGSSPFVTAAQRRPPARMRFTGLGLLDPADPSLRRVAPVALRRSLAAGPVAFAKMAERADGRVSVLRALLARGVVHPLRDDLDPRATAAAQRLTAVTGRSPVPAPDRIQVIPALGSALPASAELSADQQATLGGR